MRTQTESKKDTESRYVQLLGTGAGDANFGEPASAGLSIRDVRRYACNYLTPDVLIDINEHTLAALDTFGIEGHSIRHLLVSHGHYDHFNPVELLRFAESLPHPLAVYGNAMVRDALDFCRGHAFDPESGRFVVQNRPFNVKVHTLAPGTPVIIGDMRVTPVLANHTMNKPYCIMEHQDLNFVVEAGEKVVFYNLDSSYPLPGTVEVLSRFRFDIAILDATFGPREIDPAVSGHHNWRMLDETIAELRAAGCIDEATVVVADHLSTNTVEPYDEIADTLAAKGITLAYDGMKLALSPQTE